MTACFETETRKEFIQKNCTESRTLTLEQQGAGSELGLWRIAEVPYIR